ncbi:hypothetical protein RZS08_13525, partial [Arthrospira platensis SPKY1]|nr:hypothetical protein [Arthrospira platensis SPKY1]
AAGAFLSRQPDHRRSRRRGGRRRDAQAHHRRQAQGGGDPGAVSEELAAGEPAQTAFVAVEVPDHAGLEIVIADRFH